MAVRTDCSSVAKEPSGSFTHFLVELGLERQVESGANFLLMSGRPRSVLPVNEKLTSARSFLGTLASAGEQRTSSRLKRRRLWKGPSLSLDFRLPPPDSDGVTCKCDLIIEENDA